MKKSMSFRLIVFLFAAAVMSAFLLIGGPQVSAEASAARLVTGSDALAAALSDQTCSSIQLYGDVIYEIDSAVELARPVTLTGKGATVNFAADAGIVVAAANKLTISDVSLYSPEGNSITVNGSLVIGEKVMFGGKNGILLRSGSELTSGGAAVTAADGMESLVTVETSGGSVLIYDIRLTQTKGSSDLLRMKNGSGKINMRGTIDIIAADGCAVFCPPDSAGPDIAVEDNAVFSVSAPKAVYNQSEAIPGAAVNVPTCLFSCGSGTKLGITGSYCGISAKNITIGSNSTVTAQCDSKTDQQSLRCAALSASEKLICLSGAKITIGSSGTNCGTGLYGGQIDLESLAGVIYRGINDNASAIASSGNVSVGAAASVTTNGGGYGISCAQLTTHDKSTIDINDVSADGISASTGVKIGSNSTIDIAATRSAIKAKSEVAVSSGAKVSLSSAGDAPALLTESEAGNISFAGCTVTISNTSSVKADKKAAVYGGGGLSLESSADVTVINDGDIGLLASGGNINVSGNSILRCSGGIGILSSRGSVLVSETSTLLCEGRLDSGIRVERGSLSLTGGASADIQGARFGVEVTSGDFYIDGAGSFDIRSSSDRAVFIDNGRMIIQNVERLSAWKRHDEKKNSELWWKEAVECKYSWEAPGSDKSNWLYAHHTALSPVLTQQHAKGTPQDTTFEWYDGKWRPADYSRIGQYASKPVGRANSYNIPAGKSFSWLLFGQSYDDKITFKLSEATGDGTFELLENGSFTYTAFDYTRGFQTFEFTVENSDGAVSDPVTITVFVTASKPPIASSATFPVTGYEHFIEQVSVIDYDGDIASLKISQRPEHGTLVLNSDGKFSYQAEEGFVGIDSFSYYAIDNMGDESNIARITLPVMMEEAVVCNSTIITESSTPGSIRLTALLGSETVTPAPVFNIISHPVYGTCEFSESEPDVVTYHPYQDFSGTDSFTFVAVMPDGSVTAEGFVSIATIPSQRPVANSGVFYCSRNGSCTGRLTGYDIDGKISVFSVVEQPANGQLELDSVTGEFRYRAGSGFTGTDTFSFTVTDTDGLSGDPVQVEIVVSSLIDNLRQTGRLGAAVVILCAVLIGVAAVVTLIIISASRRRREERMEIAKSRLFEFGGSEQNDGYYNGYDDYYDDYNQ